MQMEDLKEKTTDLADHVGDFADTFYKLTILKLTQKTTNIASGILLGVAIGIFGFLVVLFLSTALALWLGDLIESRAGGFLITAGIFVVLLAIIAAIRKKVVFPFIRNRIIRKIYD